MSSAESVQKVVMVKSFTDTGDTGSVKFKVINSPEDIKEFLKEAMETMTKVKVADPVKENSQESEEEEEKDDDLKSLLWVKYKNESDSFSKHLIRLLSHLPYYLGHI